MPKIMFRRYEMASFGIIRLFRGRLESCRRSRAFGAVPRLVFKKVTERKKQCTRTRFSVVKNWYPGAIKGWRCSYSGRTCRGMNIVDGKCTSQSLGNTTGVNPEVRISKGFRVDSCPISPDCQWFGAHLRKWSPLSENDSA